MVLALAAACGPARTPAPAASPADAVPSAVLPAPRGDTATVRALVAEPARYAGRTLAVRGRCLGWNGPALGSGPLTRSDWQLGQGGDAVWVSAPLPVGCTGPAGGGEVMFRGSVVVDTVTVRASGQRRARAYLMPPER